jgi:hypothetical protein
MPHVVAPVTLWVEECGYMASEVVGGHEKDVKLIA